jgi:hypothetical protein
MFTDRQKEIISEWENQTESEKHEIREKAAETLSELCQLSALPPEEVREIVIQALDEYADDIVQFRGRMVTSHRNTRKPSKSKALVMHLTAMLFTSVREDVFQEGVNDAIAETVRWWQDSGHPAGYLLYQGLTSEQEYLNISEVDFPRYISQNRLNSCPTRERTRLARIFELWGATYFSENKLFIEYFIDTALDDIDENERVADPVTCHHHLTTNHRWVKQDDLPIDISQIDQYIGPAKEIIRNSRREATKAAHSLNNPKVPRFQDNHLTGDLKREFVILHREYLKKQGILPDEKDIPEYSEPHPRPPYPPAISFGEWSWEDPVDRS